MAWIQNFCSLLVGAHSINCWSGRKCPSPKLPVTIHLVLQGCCLHIRWYWLERELLGPDCLPDIVLQPCFPWTSSCLPLPESANKLGKHLSCKPHFCFSCLGCFSHAYQHHLSYLEWAQGILLLRTSLACPLVSKQAPGLSREVAPSAPLHP